MAEALKGSKKTEPTLSEVEPTLFIGLGGTGAEVLLRIRRKILSKVWHDENGQPFELGSLVEFPFAEFLQIDLDASTVTECGKVADPLADKIRFKEEEKLVKKLDLGKYVKTDDELTKYPMVHEWFPLSRSKLNELNIVTHMGAGQIRAISRLYFFDKYHEIKSAIRTKADHLRANLSSYEAQKRLGIKIEMGALKIVVVASTAGGTGSGMFLDMGYLSGIIGKQAASGYVTTNLVLTLPTGYGTFGGRKEANTYAALMELETCMRPGSRYIKGWNESEIIRDWPDAPYSDIYLVDTQNLAGAQSKDIKDVYDMVADSLFGDLSMSVFSNRKRAVVVCKKQHKISPYSSLVDRVTYGDMKLTFSRGYSSFGQATLDFGHDGQVGIDADQENPLFAVLDAQPNRAQLFSDFLQRAMPWVDASLDTYLRADYSQNQYTCLIGVKDSQKFEARYGAELRSRVPTDTLMALRGVIFVEIDTPGKVVCYVELSGLPLPSLKALDNWYTAYREENAKIPVHTHKRASTFVHPRELTTDELASRAEDFKLFVEAVALGVLVRTEMDEEAGWYKMQVEGGKRNIGDEKMLRQEGFPASHRTVIQQQVELNLEAIKTDDQLALWVALMGYYLESVYPLVIRYQDGVDKGLPTLICERLVNEWTSRLQNKVGGETQAERLLRAARVALIQWSEEIPGSIADVYQYEVNIKAIKSKRALKREVLQAGWSLGGVQPVASAAAPQAEPMQGLAYYVAVNKQQTGPYNAAMLRQLVASGHLTPQTVVWKKGMAGWLEASLVPELQSLFVVSPPLGAVPPPLA